MGHDSTDKYPSPDYRDHQNDHWTKKYDYFKKYLDLDALWNKAYLDSARASLTNPDEEESKKETLISKPKLVNPWYQLDLRFVHSSGK